MLVQFAEHLDNEAYCWVIALDTAIQRAPFDGLIETIPAFVSLLIRFDPLRVGWSDVEERVRCEAAAATTVAQPAATHVIPVCYDPSVVSGLAETGARLGLEADDMAQLHGDATYQVFMYGFAPGYAYLGGVPEALHLPRKPRVVRGYPAGSVIIAGAQCLITTLDMPTGWWVIGRTSVKVLDASRRPPFLLNPGDFVRFEPIPGSSLADGVAR